MSYTPGPWKAVDGQNRANCPSRDCLHDARAAVIREGTGQLIAATLDGDAEQIANARLIAAAPDLLAALEAQEAWDRHQAPPWGHDCQWCAGCCERIAIMRRAAIEKAKRS